MNPLPDMSGPPLWYDATVLALGFLGLVVVVRQATRRA